MSRGARRPARTRIPAAGLLATTLLVGGCMHPHTTPPDGPGAELADVPFFPQEKWQCGPAALATVLTASGSPTDPEALVSAIFIPGRQGSLQPEIIAASRRAGRVPWVIEGTLDALVAELDAGRPVLVLQNLLLASWPKWHYAVVVGYDPAQRALVLRPGTRKRLVEPLDRFMRGWNLAGNWGLVTLAPGALPARGNPERFIHALTDMAALTDSLPERGRGLDLSYAAASGRWRGHPTVLFASANHAYEHARLGEARRLYEDVLRLDPAHVAARNNYATLLAEQGCRSAALRQARHADALVTPDDPLAGAVRETLRSLGSGPGSGPGSGLGSGLDSGKDRSRAGDAACPDSAGTPGPPLSGAASPAPARNTSRG